MNLNKSQAKYYIERKLISNNYLEVVEGLEELQNFLFALDIEEMINSLIMRLIDIYKGSKISYLKIKASKILMKFGNKLNDLPNKQQIITNLAKCLKYKDEFTRILTLETIQLLPALFDRQNSVYHTLLNKLRCDGNVETKEKMRAITCLSSLLKKSKYLSKLLSRNLNELLTIGKIDRKILLYLSIDANFEVQYLANIISQFWTICKSRLTKIIRFYLKKFIYQSAYKNYKVLILYRKEIFNSLPSLSPQLAFIKEAKYPFLAEECVRDLNSLTNTELLDICYSLPEAEQKQLVYQCQSRIDQALLQNSINAEVFLLTFYSYSEKNDFNLNKILENSQFLRDKKMLKIALVTANFQCAFTIIKQLFNKVQKSFSGLIIIKSYIDYHLAQEIYKKKKFHTMCQIALNISKANQESGLQFLFEGWKNAYFESECSFDCEGKVKCEEEIQELVNKKRIKKPEKFHSEFYLGKKTVIDILDKL